jgi:hypothetical protein
MLPALAALLTAHMVADYPLQMNWMAENKHEHIAPLLSHSLIHGTTGATLLYLVGVSPVTAGIVGVELFVVHFLIDYSDLSIRWDQTAHFLSIVWLALVNT